MTLPPRSPRAAVIQNAALALPEEQRVALANALVLSLRDPGCRQALTRVRDNAVLTLSGLDRDAFDERDRRRRVVS